MYDVIIVGAGTAGLTAAMYAARANIAALTIEKGFPGGQIASANMVDNYPGFPEGVSGMELALKMKEQAERHGATIKIANVTGYELEGDIKKIITTDGTYEAAAVVLAMGAKYRKLGIRSEGKLIGSGVSYCATCDGAFFKGRDVAVIGGGDTALEDALYLANFANKIYLVHRRDEFRGQKVLQKAVMDNEKIELVLSYVIESIEGKFAVSSVKLKSKKTQEIKEIEVAGVFVAIGTIPETQDVIDMLATDESGYIVADANMETSLPGVYAVGDINQKSLRQVITASADGAIAIYSIQSYLMERQ